MIEDKTVVKVNFRRKRKPKSSFEFTIAKVDKLETDTEFTYDDKNRGLCLRYGETYYTYAKQQGTRSSPKVTIGHKTAITLAEAIRRNHVHMALLAEGINPNHRKLEKVEEEKSIGYYIRRFLKDASKSGLHSLSTTQLNEGILNNHLKEIEKYTFGSLPPQLLVDTYLDSSYGVSKQMLTILGAVYNSLTRAEKKEAENPSDIIVKQRRVQKPVRTRRHRHLAIEGEHEHLGMWFKAMMSRLYGLENPYYPEYAEVKGIDWDSLTKSEVEIHKAEAEKYYQEVVKYKDWLIKPARTRDDTWVDAMLLASLTCIRRAEVMKLTWDDVNFEEEYFVVEEPKGYKKKNEDDEAPNPMLVPFTAYTKALFLKRKEQSKYLDSPLVFNKTDQNIYEHARQVGLVMSMLGYKYYRLRRKEHKKLPIPKSKHSCSLNQQSYSELRELLKKGKIDINGIGMHMHDLRRTTGNVAEYLGIGRQTVETMLNHSPNTTGSKHYIETMVEPYRKALQICNEYMDNRIAEYLYVEDQDKQTDETFVSPILDYLKAEENGVLKDEYYKHHSGFESVLEGPRSKTKTMGRFKK